MAMTTRQRLDVMLSAQGGLPSIPDAYLDLLAEDAEQVVCHYRNTDVIEPKYIPVAARIANYWLEKTGYRGASSISESGISRSYETGDVPDSLLRQITPTATVI